MYFSLTIYARIRTSSSARSLTLPTVSTSLTMNRQAFCPDIPLLRNKYQPLSEYRLYRQTYYPSGKGNHEYIPPY
jgi:hypothetical protein